MTRTDDSVIPDYGSLLSLEGRAFVVLGAGQGIGRQATHALARSGARLICVDKVEDLAHDVAAEVKGTAVVADVTTRAGVELAVGRAVQEFGRLDGLVDIVGIAQWQALIDIDDEAWDADFNNCLRHAFLAMQIGARAMQTTGGGAMAFVASISGLASAPNHAGYGAAKAGLMALVRTAAVEFGPLGIRVNAVAPGTTLTPRVSGMLDPVERTRQEELNPTGRLNVPSDIAAALLFLVSDLAANITGQTLVADGGITSRFACQ
jgi:NAD(P)-dependent dehydrogenase (short-subunit alcohol dehydrogenase family)